MLLSTCVELKRLLFLPSFRVAKAEASVLNSQDHYQIKLMNFYKRMKVKFVEQVVDQGLKEVFENSPSFLYYQ